MLQTILKADFPSKNFIICLNECIVINFNIKPNCLKPFLLLSFLLWNILAYAQQVRQPVALNYVGIGTYSKNFNDVFSASVNQASLAQLKSGGFGVYGERRFLLDELNQYSAIIALPTTTGTFAIQGDYFGSTHYNESQVGIAYGRKITERIDVGVKFNYLTTTVAGYGDASAINFEVGTILHLTDNLHAGIHVYNPLSSKLGKTGTEKIPSIYRIGLGYEVSDRVFLCTEIVKQEDQPVGVNAGFHYSLHEKFFLRGGIATATNNSYAGVGLNLNVFRIDLTASYHPQLGFTPGLLLLLNFKKAEQK
ncbi:MAG: hypothetical protein JWQ96_1494 [Segetibacter sp.]|nr:hypothetical protein [Segetibacter sp.]